MKRICCLRTNEDEARVRGRDEKVERVWRRQELEEALKTLAMREARKGHGLEKRQEKEREREKEKEEENEGR
ncbi:hypothetical protein M8J75_006264 [Diaphorina citri]|nr:hypothetical protein M8J75_006264 [Diaphorina citri]